MNCLLVVAKAPVAGLAKTRLMPAATPEQAADIAAAALLDTLDAVLATPDVVPVVAMTGSLAGARQRDELGSLLDRCAVIFQRGEGFPRRLANAHADVAARFPGHGVLQIGMDTPQVTSALLRSALTGMRADGVLGLAEDGGWWALGLRDPLNAAVLAGVPTSRADTGRLTLGALRANGLQIGELPCLSDVDTMDDALRVAESLPNSRFARAVVQVGLSRAAR